MALVVRPSGNPTADLESLAAGRLGWPVVALGSARAALAIAIDLLSEPGCTVFVPAYTCVAVPNAVDTAGLPIAWVDIVGPNIDVQAVLDRASPGDVVVAQHTYGVPIDPAAIRALRAKGLRVVEDRAHRFDGIDIAGDVAIFSLEHSKVVSGGQGGLLLAPDRALADRARAARDRMPNSGVDAGRILRTSATQRLLAGTAVPAPVSSFGRRLALRLPPLSEPGQTADEIAGGPVALRRLHPRLAAAALSSIANAQAALDHRTWAASQYVERLGAIIPEWARSPRPYLRMPAVVEDGALVARRLRSAGLDLGPRWFEAPVHPAGSRSSYPAGMAPNAERLARQVLSLPTHSLISEADIDAVSSAILAAT